MLKKIILGFLILVLILVSYIGVLWFMSLNSIMDKDGMVYKEYNKNIEIKKQQWKIWYYIWY